MLNIGVNLNIDIKRSKMPIAFNSNICVHCGAENELTFVDKFGKETRSEVYPFDHIKCKKCGSQYSILWTRDDNTGRMRPSACDPSLKREFFNLVTYPVVKFIGTENL